MRYSLSSFCAPCQKSFTSYSQHLPIAVLPQGNISLQTLNDLVDQGQVPTSFFFDDTGTVWQPVSSLNEEPGVILSCRTDNFSPPTVIPVISECYSTPDLPNEIWIRIFAEVSTDFHQWLTPLRISLVCRHWRRPDIAHSTPQLWTSICADVPYVKRSGRWTSWRIFEIVWWYLHLSKHKALDVKVDLLGYDGDFEFERTVEMVTEHSARWRSADIRVAPSSLMYFKGVARRLPLLESLWVDVSEEAYRDNWKRFKGFRHSPKLVSHSPGGISPRQCIVPWKQLKTVILRDFFDCLYDDLRDSKTLDHLILSPECEFETGFGSVTTLRASTLTLQSFPRLVASFLEGFRFPFLTSLNLSVPDAEYARPFPTDSLLRLLQQSQCEIQHLVLKRVHILCEDMINVLRATPTLMSLVIHEPASTYSQTHCITNEFLRYLTMCTVLPKLKTLELVWNYDAYEDCIISMVESRIMKSSAYEGVQLEGIVLGRRNGVDLELPTIERMNGLRKCGLHVSLW
ncbi:uncharacterized protein EV420DRAFT_1017756 [Desarmillaria tabescens]|uniref:F-box domain-containing protein n=1 Tax=Armillaria tabescens TaxID=1929756 RepID=A0AA39JJK7_ARMTA|nr:uncharacterized protein EV420DRAFT_1017756 [Desarmillaria tabescens]KAK0443961.1 hypothetical protein EV420DRAFT_1017756 [Desarmillaria tabescens]